MHRLHAITFCLWGFARLGSAGNLECGPANLDLGVIPQGKLVTVDRWCQNTGTRELHLQSIQTGCTCLSAKSEKTIIPPGGRARLVMQMQTSPLADKVEFAVEILFRGKELSTEYLSVTADVRPSVVAIPEYLDLGDFRKNGLRQFLVVDTTGRDFGVRQTTTSRSEVDVRWTPVELVRMGDKWEPATRGGAVTGYQFTVQCKPGSTKHSLSDEVQIDLIHDLQKSIRIRIVGYSP